MQKTDENQRPAESTPGPLAGVSGGSMRTLYFAAFEREFERIRRGGVGGTGPVAFVDYPDDRGVWGRHGNELLCHVTIDLPAEEAEAFRDGPASRIYRVPADVANKYLRRPAAHAG